MNFEIEKLKNGDLASAINHGDAAHYKKLICEIAQEPNKDKRLSLFMALGLAIFEAHTLYTDALEFADEQEKLTDILWGETPVYKGGIAA